MQGPQSLVTPCDQQRWGSCPVAGTRFSAVAILGLLLASAPADAQPPPDSALPNPRLFTVIPPGGRTGTTVEVSFTGADVEEPQGLIFSNPAIKAGALLPSPAPPPDPKKPTTAPTPPSPITRFMVTIPVGTPAGSYDVRLVNKWGVSNARAFEVGDLEEVLEKEPNNEIEQAQRVRLNTTVNGAITSPTDVDFYVFYGKKGERVVVSCLASSIDSRLVAGVEMYDRAGRLLAANHHYRGTDALADCTLPEDGDYFVRVHEFAYTSGDAEHFYRLTISSAPWIDAIWPPVIQPGIAATVTVYGRNLPDGRLDPAAVIAGRNLEKISAVVRAPADPLARVRLGYTGFTAPGASSMDGFEYRVCNSAGGSNPALITFASAPVVLDNEVNKTPTQAQEVTAPCEIAGRVKNRGERHWYAFAAKKGEVHAMELFGERLGASSDVYFLVRNAATNLTLGEFDDTTDALSPSKFVTGTSDPPRYRFVAPEDGRYQVMVSSRKAVTSSDPRQTYRLSIVREEPDFRLVVMPPAEYTPDAPCLLRGGDQSLTVLAWRLDGWNGPIRLEAEGLPPGVTCAPQMVNAGARQANLVLSASRMMAPGVWELKVKGTAEIGGKMVTREARPAGVTWPVPPMLNIPAISRLDRNFVVAVRERAPYRVGATLDKPASTQGEKASLTLKLERLWPDFKAPLQAVGVDLPPNFAINNNQPMTIAADKDAAIVPVNIGPNVPPGTYSFLLRTTAQVPYSKDSAAKQKPSINVVLPSTPVTVSILPRQVAALSLLPSKVALKAGGEGEITIKLARMFDFAGEFKVRVVFPANAKGVTAPEVTVAPGKTEVKLPLRVEPGAAPAILPDLIVRAVAMLGGNVSATHDAKLSLSIVK
jgi:hypothetical protein